MKKKYLKDFVSLFDQLFNAGRALADGEYTDHKGNSTLDDITRAYEKAKEMKENSLLEKLMDEIESNLYKYAQSRHAYLCEIFRQFYHITPFLDTEAEVEYSESGYGHSKDFSFYSRAHYFTYEYIRKNSHLHWPEPCPDMPVEEKYVVLCRKILVDFTNRLDRICLNLDIAIDFIKIQEELGIYLVRERDTINLMNDGYRNLAEKVNGGRDYANLTDTPWVGECHEIKALETDYQIKPKLKPEMVVPVFEKLKGFFSEEHQDMLKKILQTGANSPFPLVFLDKGNRLADFFKRLYTEGYITGCQKKELENWIAVNFQFRDNQEIKNFKPRYLNDIISSNRIPCKNPIPDLIENKSKELMIRKAF